MEHQIGFCLKPEESRALRYLLRGVRGELNFTITFCPWRDFVFGGYSKESLHALVLASTTVSPKAAQHVERIDVQETEVEEIETIILMPEDFSGEGALPTARQLFDSKWLLAWSRRNSGLLPRGCVVDTLPEEACLYIRGQYLDQPKNEELFIARQISWGQKPAHVFRIGRTHEGCFWLNLSLVKAGDRLERDDRIVFRLRRVAGERLRTSTYDLAGCSVYREDGSLRTLDEIRDDVVRLAVKHCKGQVTEMARQLGVGRSSLHRWLQNLGLNHQSDRAP